MTPSGISTAPYAAFAVFLRQQGAATLSAEPGCCCGARTSMQREALLMARRSKCCCQHTLHERGMRHPLIEQCCMVMLQHKQTSQVHFCNAVHACDCYN